MQALQSNKSQHVNEILRTYQGLLLDVLEESFGQDKSWQSIRSRVLRLLGDNGLGKRIRELVTSSECGGGQ